MLTKKIMIYWMALDLAEYFITSKAEMIKSENKKEELKIEVLKS